MATYYIGAQAFGINSLAHVAPYSKGWKKQNAKYIERYMGKNGKWQYVYEDPSNKRTVHNVKPVRVNKPQAVSKSPSHGATATGYGLPKSPTYQPQFKSPSHGATATGYGLPNRKPQPQAPSNSVSTTSNDNRYAGNDRSGIRDVSNDPFSNLIQSARRLIDRGRNWIEGAFNNVVGAVRGAAETVGRLATKAWNAVKSAGSTAIKRGKEFVGKIIHDVKDYIKSEDAKRRMTNGKTAMERLKGREDYYNTDTGDAKRRAEQGATAMERLQGRQDYNRTIAGRLENASSNINRALSNARTFMSDTALAAGRAIGEAVENAGGRILGFIQGDNGPQAVVEVNGVSTYVPISANEFEVNGVRIHVDPSQIGTK